MSRTLKNTGIAANLDFLWAIDDDNTTPRVFKSLDSSNSDNTTAVHGDMTTGANVTTGTYDWNGHTIPYIANGTDYTWISFGTNKPYMKIAASETHTYFIIHQTPTANALCRAFGGADAGSPSISIQNSGGLWYGILDEESGGHWLAISASGVSTSNKETWAFKYTATNAATAKAYIGTAGSTLSQSGAGNTEDNPYVGINGALSYLGGTSAEHTWYTGKISMVGKFNTDIALTDLQALHADPYGTLFSTGTVAIPRLLTLGAG